MIREIRQGAGPVLRGTPVRSRLPDYPRTSARCRPEVHFQKLDIGLDVSCKDYVYKIDDDLQTDLLRIAQMIFDKKEEILKKTK